MMLIVDFEYQRKSLLNIHIYRCIYLFIYLFYIFIAVFIFFYYYLSLDIYSLVYP